MCDVRHARWPACTVDPCLTLTRDPTAPCRRLFEGEALLRRMYRYGFLDESQNKLDYVLALTPQDVLERRLQVRGGGGAGAAQPLGCIAGLQGGAGRLGYGWCTVPLWACCAHEWQPAALDLLVRARVCCDSPKAAAFGQAGFAAL